MDNENKSCEKCHCFGGGKKGGACGGAYGLGFVGALVFYIQNAETFWMGALGVLKALVWPAMLIYKLLVFLS